LEKLQSGVLQRSDLQRSAKDVLNFILNVPAIEHKLGRISPEELEEMNAKEDNDFSPVDLKFYKVDKSGEEVKIDGSNIITKRGECWVAGIEVTKFGLFEISVTMKSELGSLAQLPISVFLDGTHKTTISIQGTEGKWVTETRELGVIVGNNHYLKLFFGADGIELDEITIHLVEAIELPF
jgi:beta-glucosidase